MSEAYIDSSCVLALVFDEQLRSKTLSTLEGYAGVLSSNLLEAEVRAALVRERVDEEPSFLSKMDWVLPTRPLTREIQRALEVGYLRGADLWHIATALYSSEDPTQLPFLTLDRRQSDVAAALGFPTPLMPLTI